MSVLGGDGLEGRERLKKIILAQNYTVTWDFSNGASQLQLFVRERR